MMPNCNHAELKKTIHKVRAFWSEGKSFSFLLFILIIYIFVIIPLVDERRISKLLFIIFYFLLLTGGVPFLVKNRKTGIVFLLTILPFLILFSGLLIKSVWMTVSADLFIVLYCISLGAIILIRTFSTGHVTSNRVQGAVVAYLLAGFIFAMLYHVIFLMFGQGTFHGLADFRRTEFMYFSLTTLTTVGYGDITPVNEYARSLANLESLVGQLYPAILIARLVSMEFSTSKEK